MSYSIVGIIKDGCWKVAEFCVGINNPKSFYAKCFAPVIKNKKIINQNICRCKFVRTLDNWLFAEAKTVGSGVIEEIIKLEDGGELELADARKLLDDEHMCDIGYILNFDSNTLTCYHNGKRFMFGRFGFDEIDSAKKFRKVEAAYEMSIADNQNEIREINIKGIADSFRKMGATIDGADPDEAARQFMEMWDNLEPVDEET